MDKSDLPGIHSPRFWTAPSPSRVYGLHLYFSSRSWFLVGDIASLEVVNAVIALQEDQGGCNYFGTSQPLDTTKTYGSWNSSVTSDDSETRGYIARVETRRGGEVFQRAIFPWNVVQYYRGSSLALAMLEYDNAFAHNGNENTDYWASTPLNTTGLDMNLLNCINQTIAASIHIVDPTLIVRGHLSTEQIIVITVIVTLGTAFLIAGYNKRLPRKKGYSPVPETDW